MTDSAAPKPDWIPTTIEDIEARIARGEWPRVRAIADKAGPTQSMQGRMIAARGAGERIWPMLREPDLDNEPVDLAVRSLWVWAVPEPEPLAATEGMLDALDDLTEMRAGIADEWTDHVARWSEPMAAKLRANAHKGGWLHDAPKVLLDRVYGELGEVGQALAKVIWAAREGSHVQSLVVDLRREAADVANMVMMLADAVEEQGTGLRVWRIPEVRRSEPVHIAIGPYLIHEQRGPDGTSGLTIRKTNEVGSDPVFEIEASGTGNWRHSAYPSKAEDAGWLQGLSDLSPEQLEAYAATGKINGAAVAAKPGHRAVTLTAETLSLARMVGRGVANGSKPNRGWGAQLLVELQHAEGMSAADLRKLAKWARETTKACADLDSDWFADPAVVEIVDRVLLHLAIDEMPVGSIEVHGDYITEAGTDAKIEARPASARGVEARASKVELTGTHLRALGFAVDTAEIRAAIKANASKNCQTMHVDVVAPLLTEIDNLRDRVSSSRTSQRRLAVLLDLIGSEPPFPEIVAAVERLVERADEQADTLKLIADEFAGLVDPANPLLEVRAMKRDFGTLGRSLAEIGDQIGNPPNVWVTLRELIRKNRLLDVTLGPLFGISKHGQSLSAEELIDGAKAKLAEVESLDRLGDWLRENMGEHFAVEGIADSAIRQLREPNRPPNVARLVGGFDLGPFRISNAQQDDLDGHTMLVVHEAGSIYDLPKRIFAITTTRDGQWSKWTIDSARDLAQSLSDALRKIDRISHGVDPAEAMSPVITAAMADTLVGRIGRQFDGFRQLGERTMTAAAELAACEALIHRGFDRLREVDPEFVESLRKGGS
jgi:NTP pyrophosphatase (non-canonical NTP hydrolase)